MNIRPWFTRSGRGFKRTDWSCTTFIVIVELHADGSDLEHAKHNHHSEPLTVSKSFLLSTLST
eukprot:47843-Eustigmatos_ZCMA.PRE.1